jgi:hypothetical protein
MMWDRFPPRMRRIILAALDEAGRRGHEAAGAEHLVLAVCADPASGGAIVMRRCGIDLQDLSARIGAIAEHNGAPQGRAEQLEPAALNLLEAAASESDRLGDHHVGTEHLVMALPKMESLQVSRLCGQMGLTAAATEQAARQWISEGMPRGQSQFPRGRSRWFKKALALPGLAWKIFVRKSLGHPGFVRNPYPLYRWLRERDPVRKDPLAPVWILTRYDDVATMLREPRFRKDPFVADRLPAAAREQLGVPDRVDTGAVSMLFLDPPEHTRIRSAYARSFTPASLAALRPRIELICRKRLDRVHASGRMELISDLAYPLPVFVIIEMLGFPPEDFELFKRWSDDMTASLGLNPKPEEQEAAARARDELREYFDRVVIPMKNRPADSLVSRLLESEDQPGGMGREEIFTNSVLLLAAGHETTTNLIGNGVLALMRNRDQWEQLVADPTLVESAVEEMLRFDSPVQWTSRSSGEGVEIGGKTIEPEQIILGCVGAANRDPAKFVEPERFNIRRTENKHLSFGIGIHYCLGAALARMEAQIALEMLVDRYPRMKWAGAKLTWMKGLTFRGVKSLPLVLR